MLGLRERMEENGSAPGTGEAKRSAAAPADPEVVDRPLRRRFSPSYKLRIVEEAYRCTEPGEVGQVLRREGLYSSHLTTWRKAAHSGSLKALSKKRGRKPERNPLDEKVRKLERRNARLENGAAANRWDEAERVIRYQLKTGIQRRIWDIPVVVRGNIVCSRGLASIPRDKDHSERSGGP